MEVYHEVKVGFLTFGSVLRLHSNRPSTLSLLDDFGKYATQPGCDIG
jgi:hypothetical protein